MRRVVLPLFALALTLGACGTGSAPVASAPTSAPTTRPAESASDEEWADYDEWLSGGPMATSEPTRTCVTHEPTDDERAEAATNGWDAYSVSCFDFDQYWTTEPACPPPPGVAEDEAYSCMIWGSPRTQRVVDDWNAFADEEDTASARQLGMTLEEYRAAYPDGPA